MNGRVQSEAKIEESIQNRLNNMPDYVTDWYLNLKASRKTGATCNDYTRKINNFLRFINEDVKNVKVEDITERVVSEFFLSAQTKRKNGDITYTSDSYQITLWSCLNSFLGYLEKTGSIQKNYITLINKPKNHDLERINENRVLLTESDFVKIVDAVNKEKNEVRKARDMAIILVLMNTGMRRTAMSNIMLDDIDFKNKELKVIDKGNKRHVYPLNDAVCIAITDWIAKRDKFKNKKHDDHLFISDHGTMMNPNTIYNVVKKYTIRGIGRKISPHKIRSGYCSILYNKTHDAEFVRRAVGHANVATTQRYIVTKGDERKKASDIMASIL